MPTRREPARGGIGSNQYQTIGAPKPTAAQADRAQRFGAAAQNERVRAALADRAERTRGLGRGHAANLNEAHTGTNIIVVDYSNGELVEGRLDAIRRGERTDQIGLDLSGHAYTVWVAEGGDYWLAPEPGEPTTPPEATKEPGRRRRTAAQRRHAQAMSEPGQNPRYLGESHVGRTILVTGSDGNPIEGRVDAVRRRDDLPGRVGVDLNGHDGTVWLPAGGRYWETTPVG